jgi:mRNA interferase RelE/StbE
VSFQLRVGPAAQKKLEKLDRPTRERLIRRLRQLAVDPFDRRIAKLLRGARSLRSSRVGGWRIVYTVSLQERVVCVLSVNPRGEACRDL